MLKKIDKWRVPEEMYSADLAQYLRNYPATPSVASSIAKTLSRLHRMKIVCKEKWLCDTRAVPKELITITFIVKGSERDL